jgi:ABC-2 type transport system ATP-binding protein
MIKGENIFKSYGVKDVVKGISFDVKPGSIFGLLGPNGAGKTTLIRLVNQITAPEKGSLFFNQEKLTKKHVPLIGYLPEERGLYKKMKVGEHSLYLAQLRGLSKKEAKNQLSYWFQKLEMNDWWNKKIEELSKGMAQKVQFIAAVIHKPKLLILDEPFSGLDPINAQQIKNEILNLKNNGTTIIFSTHRMESIEELCDEICLINDGNKILDGNVIDIKKKFQQDIFKINYEGKLTLKDEFICIEKNENSATFQLSKDQNSKQLIEFVSNQVLIKNFNQKIPTINEIYLNLIRGNE